MQAIERNEEETLRNVTFYRCVNDWQNFWTSNSLQVEWRQPARVMKPWRRRKILSMPTQARTRPSQPSSRTSDTPKAKHRMSNFLFLTAQVRKLLSSHAVLRSSAVKWQRRRYLCVRDTSEATEMVVWFTIANLVRDSSSRCEQKYHVAVTNRFLEWSHLEFKMLNSVKKCQALWQLTGVGPKPVILPSVMIKLNTAARKIRPVRAMLDIFSSDIWIWVKPPSSLIGFPLSNK